MSPLTPYDGRARLPLRKVNHEDAEPFYVVITKIFGFLMRRTTRQDWGPPDLPATGGVIVCPNHIANFDPPAVGHFVMWSGRFPHFLSKVEVFRIPVIGWIARNCGQIPVLRGTERASDALVAARQALAAGRCIVIYPEGTRTFDPDLWPMTGRSGAARLALATRSPVIPLGNWGAEQVMPGRRVTWPRFFPRKTMHVRAGAPVALDDLYPDAGAEASPEAVHGATDRILDALTALVADLRGETPPTGRWDSRLGRRVEREPGASGGDSID